MMLWYMTAWGSRGTVRHHEAHIVFSIFMRRNKRVKLLDGVGMRLPRLVISNNGFWDQELMIRGSMSMILDCDSVDLSVFDRLWWLHRLLRTCRGRGVSTA